MLGKLEKTGMETALDRTGRSIEHDVASLGGSAVSDLQGDQLLVQKKFGAIGRSAEHGASVAKRSVHDNLHKGGNTANEAFR